MKKLLASVSLQLCLGSVEFQQTGVFAQIGTEWWQERLLPVSPAASPLPVLQRGVPGVETPTVTSDMWLLLHRLHIAMGLVRRAMQVDCSSQWLPHRLHRPFRPGGSALTVLSRYQISSRCSANR